MPTDRLANIIKAYLDGDLQLETAAAELTHVYIEHGWAFYLNESECYPEHRERMRALAARVDAALLATAAHRAGRA